MKRNSFNLECAGDQNQHEQTKDGVELGEHGEHHGRTECVVTTTNGRDTVGTHLGLTDSREEGYKTTSQTGTEDCGCDNHIVGSTLQQTLKHEEADEAVQTLRRRQGCKCDVRTAGTRILLECADGCITTNCYSVGRTYAREAHAKGNSQIS